MPEVFGHPLQKTRNPLRTAPGVHRFSGAPTFDAPKIAVKWVMEPVSGQSLQRSSGDLALRIVGGIALVTILVVLWSWWDHAAFLEWKEEAGPLPFFAALSILPAIGFPTTPFYVLAGLLFGIAGGLIGSAIALAVNLLLSFWIARSGLRPWLEAIVEKTRFSMPEMSERRALRFALLVKFTPGAPTVIKTYLIALSGVPFWIYFVLSYTVTLAWAAGFIVLGESMLDRDFSQAAAAAAVLAVLGLGTWFLLRRRRRRNEADAGGSALNQ
jgi:uncharacterized membrane protein YdjX (TVP38/TMEM64 family)